jgi:hypothetical protein
MNLHPPFSESTHTEKYWLLTMGADNHLLNASRIHAYKQKYKHTRQPDHVCFPSNWPFVHFGPVFWLGEWKFWTTCQFGECPEKKLIESSDIKHTEYVLQNEPF